MAASTVTKDLASTFEWINESDKCGICGFDFQIPKSLKCLHSFCLDCLSRKANIGENSLLCPTCDEKTQLPNRGVDGLNTNYMLIRKQERKSFEEKFKEKDALIPCTYCDNASDHADSKAVAWCKECQDYLCDIACKNHNSQRKAKLHEVISLDKLRSGDVPSVGTRGERMCPKHKDEKLRFYCETCEVPFCRDCGVIEHPRGESHVQNYLEDAVKNRRNDIEKEAEECKRVTCEVEDTILQDERNEAALKKAVDQTLDDYEEAAKNVVSKFSDNQKQHKDKFAEDLTQFHERRKMEIDSHKQKLKNVRSRIDSALAMAQMLTVSGTQYDVADMYKDVITALRDLREFKPVADRISNVVFKLNEDCLPAVECLPAPGKLNCGIWELEHEFGKVGNGKLSRARGLAFTSSGDIVVTDGTVKKLQIFNGRGEYKATRSANILEAWDVTITNDGRCFVVDNSEYIRKHDNEIEFSSSSSVGHSGLCGIAARKTGGWVTVSYTNNKAYVCDKSGTKTNTFSIVKSRSIAVTSKDSFVFSSDSQKSVQVVTIDGRLMQIIGPPESLDINSWNPTGVCCSQDDEILVANHGEGAMGIYMFKLSGEFIDCITAELNKPWGLAMTDDGEKLAVVDDNGASVKIFGLR